MLNIDSPVILSLLEKTLDFSHILLGVFILIGWIVKRFRKMHLIITLITGISWIVFIPFQRFGYCILADWHWQMLAQMGKTGLPETYAQYLYQRITGLFIKKETVQIIVRLCWLGAFTLSSSLLLRSYYFKRKMKMTK